MEDIYLVVDPELPCNGCNRPGKAGIAYKKEKHYVCDIVCKDCALHMNKVYTGEVVFGQETIDPVELWDYSRTITTDGVLQCALCSRETEKSYAMRSDQEFPHNMLLYPYCREHEQEVKELIG